MLLIDTCLYDIDIERVANRFFSLL